MWPHAVIQVPCLSTKTGSSLYSLSFNCNIICEDLASIQESICKAEAVLRAANSLTSRWSLVCLQPALKNSNWEDSQQVSKQKLWETIFLPSPSAFRLLSASSWQFSEPPPSLLSPRDPRDSAFPTCNKGVSGFTAA